MDYGTVFAGLATQATGAVTDVAPIAVPVLGLLVGITIALKVFRKVAK